MGARSMQHGRGETTNPSTGEVASQAKGHGLTPAGGSDPATPNTNTSTGGTVPEPRRAEQRVFVLDRHGKPLMPTTPRRARELLQSGRARVAHLEPFVIRIVDRLVEDSEIDPLILGIDPGSKHTGVALARETQTVDTTTGEITTTRDGLFLLRVDHRGEQTHQNMCKRSAYRRRRRTANLRYRAPRFDNRTRPDGWLAPSLQHRVETTLTWVRRLAKWAPIGQVAYEAVRFDMTKIQNPDIAGVEYQQGTLAGTEIRQYVLTRDGHRCVYCGKTGVGPGSVPMNLDHVHPKAKGGSDRPASLVASCVPCNQKKSDTLVEGFLADRPNVLRRVNAHRKMPLKDAAAVNTTRRALHRALAADGFEMNAYSGGRMKWNRKRTGVPKDHCLDALCVGLVDRIGSHPGVQHVAKATGRGVHCRTHTDKYGFPRSLLSRIKVHHGIMTGDHVRAAVPRGKHAGTYTGRIGVRANGSMTVVEGSGRKVDGTSYKNIRLLQHADGYHHSREEVPHADA